MDQVATRRSVLALAVVLALLAAVLIGVYVKTLSPTATGKVPAVYAKQIIPASTVIEPGMVEQREVPRTDVPDGTAADRDSVVGRVAMASFGEGQRIQADQVQEKSSALGLAFVVPTGMRAVTVALDPIIGVAGFLKPGNHVDVLATFNANEGSITKTVLQDQVLLATGSQTISATQATGKQTQPESVPNATLAVDPVDAEKLILAESKGKLRLTLRAQGDMVRSFTRGINSRALIGFVPPDIGKQQQGGQRSASTVRYINTPMTSPNPLAGIYGPGMGLPQPVARPETIPQPEQPTVEVIKGAQVERVPVKT